MISTDSAAWHAPIAARSPEQRLYLMAKPLESQARAIDRLCRRYGLDRRYDWTRLHLTLVPLGDFRLLAPGDLDRILAVAAMMQAESIEIVLHRIRGNALVGRGTAPLRHFQRDLIARLAAYGVTLPNYRFAPHVSLVYGERTPRNIAIDPIRWRIDAFQLVNSVHGQGHRLLGEWRLESRQRAFDF